MKPQEILRDMRHREYLEEQFCTECGDVLENFCFSGTAKDLESIRKLLAECKKKHRFTGGLCAKLYIAGPVSPENLDDLLKEQQ